MSKIRNFTLGLATLGSVAATNAQQSAARYSETPQASIIELFNIRNGTSFPATTGNKGYYTRDNQGYIGFVDAATLQALTSNGYSPLPNPNTPNETIGNGVFETMGEISQSRLNFKSSDNSITLDITTQQYDTTRDAVSDGNTNVDVLHTTYHIPKTLNGGGAIPLNTRCIIKTRSGTDIDTGDIYGGKLMYLQRDGSTRVPRDTNRNGFSSYNFQIMGTDGQLGVEEYTPEQSRSATVYPNPVQDSFSFDNGNSNTDEMMSYTLVDITGKVIDSGTLRENQPQTLTPQAPGIKILVVKDEEGNTTTKKIITK